MRRIAAIRGQPTELLTGRPRQTLRKVARNVGTPLLKGLRGVFVPLPETRARVARVSARTGQIRFSVDGSETRRLITVRAPRSVLASPERAERWARREIAKARRRGDGFGSALLANGHSALGVFDLRSQSRRDALAGGFGTLATYRAAREFVVGLVFQQAGAGGFEPPRRRGARQTRRGAGNARRNAVR